MGRGRHPRGGPAGHLLALSLVARSAPSALAQAMEDGMARRGPAQAKAQRDELMQFERE
jgi:hypothetical protein